MKCELHNHDTSSIPMLQVAIDVWMTLKERLENLALYIQKCMEKCLQAKGNAKKY